jgi:exopolysaccharide biosynthesis polyprenyl glycosylphosphotransferase
MKKRSELIFTIALIPVDLLMVLLAFILAYKFRFYFNLVPITYFEPFEQYFRFALMTIPFWIVIFALNGLYSTDRRGVAREFGKICVSVSAAVALLMVEIFLTRTFFFSRLVIAFSWILAIILVMIGRYLLLLLQRLLYFRGVGVHKVMVIGDNGLAKSMVRQLNEDKKLGYKMVKLIDREGIKKLETIFANTPVDDILIADAELDQEEVVKVMTFCRNHNLGFKVIPNLFLVQSAHASMQTLAGIPVVEFKRTPLDGWNRIIKRIFDIISSIILIIITSPFMLITALIIKLTDRGPVLFKQERVGLDRNFKLLKFRSMKFEFCTGPEYGGDKADKLRAHLAKNKNEVDGPVFKIKNDPRISTFGRFIRKTSLDEFPQFFNVLKGDMSLIGPRPPMPEEVARYTEFQKTRLGVKPGITGMWQVSGRSELSFDEWVRLDAYYIEHWSLWLDFVIFLKTIWVVIKGRGAC